MSSNEYPSEPFWSSSSSQGQAESEVGHADNNNLEGGEGAHGASGSSSAMDEGGSVEPQPAGQPAPRTSSRQPNAREHKKPLKERATCSWFRWNSEEDKRLMAIFAEDEDYSWNDISRKLGTGRTGQLCMDRYIVLKDQANVDAKAIELGLALPLPKTFSSQDDATLRAAAATVLWVEWSDVGLNMNPPRTGDACFKRHSMLWKAEHSGAPKTSKSTSKAAQPARASSLRSVSCNRWTQQDNLLLYRMAATVTSGIETWESVALNAFNGLRTSSACQQQVYNLKKLGRWSFKALAPPLPVASGHLHPHRKERTSAPSTSAAQYTSTQEQSIAKKKDERRASSSGPHATLAATSLSSVTFVSSNPHPGSSATPATTSRTESIASYAPHPDFILTSDERAAALSRVWPFNFPLINSGAVATSSAATSTSQKRLVDTGSVDSEAASKRSRAD